MATEIAQKSKRLNWEYCECGCKGHAVSLGVVHLWMGTPAGPDSPQRYKLHIGHGWTAPLISTHNSFDEADEAARKVLSPEFARMKASIEASAHLFQ